MHISLTFLSFFLFLITFLLSHQIFRDQISKHRLRKIRYSRLLNQSIFWLILSDNKLTVSPIYACIQMEVGFVSLLYTNICTTFAIFSKEEELLSLSSTPYETRCTFIADSMELIHLSSFCMTYSLRFLLILSHQIR